MAAAINNIAATFSKIAPSLNNNDSNSSPPSFSSDRLKNFPQSISPNPNPSKSISTTWNPQAILTRSKQSSLVNLFGPPGPPQTSIPAVHRNHRPSISIGDRIPDVTLSYLTKNDAVQSVNLARLCKQKRVVLIGASVPFSPSCNRFVKRTLDKKSTRAVDLVMCVAVNDVFVMRAWGEHLGVDERVSMLSDGQGELYRALGVLSCSDDKSKGLFGDWNSRSTRFSLCLWNGVITAVDFDHMDGGDA